MAGGHEQGAEGRGGGVVGGRGRCRLLLGRMVWGGEERKTRGGDMFMLILFSGFSVHQQTVCVQPRK